MDMTYICLYLDWSQKTSCLDDAEKGRLIDAMVAYARGDEPNIVGNERFVFPCFKTQIDRDRLALEQKSSARRSAVMKRWHPEQNTCDTNVQDVIQNVQADTNDTKNKKNKNKKNNNNTQIESKRFAPPTLEQLRAYISENGLNVDAERFIDYYTSAGWMVGRNRMKDWQATVRNWSRRSNVEQARPVVKKVNAQNYDQRTYTQAEIREMEERTRRWLDDD